METLALASSKPLLRFDSSPSISTRTLLPPPLLFRRLSKLPNSRLTVRANNSSHGDGTGLRVSIDANTKLRAQVFASVFSSIGRGGRETSSVAVPPQIAVPPPSYQFGSPLFWIGVGVGFSALFSWLASYMKNYAMQQAFKAMKEQMGSQNSQSGTSPFSSGTPFPFPPPSTVGGATSPGSPFPFPFSPPVTTTTSGPASTPRATISESTATVDATKIEAAPVTDVKVDEEVKSEPKRIAFEDVSPDEGLPKSPFEKFEVSSTSTTSKDVKFAEVVPDNGAATSGASASNESWSSTGNAGSFMTVEALEKMMEDPTVQQMVYPHLPEEMRNPATFKWMLQNPEYRKQLQDMLNNMGGGGNAQWDSRMMDNLKNFDLSSPDVKQQFDQIGLTPEEVITKIMANPEIAMAFQNPRVQAAIMDCSQNPYNITKYQNDKEVMDVFNKISELFPGVSGFP